MVGGMSATGCTGCTGWAHAAAERGWRTKGGKPAANRELWEQLLDLDGRLSVSWRQFAATGRRRTRATTPATTARSMRSQERPAWTYWRGSQE